MAESSKSRVVRTHTLNMSKVTNINQSRQYFSIHNCLIINIFLMLFGPTNLIKSETDGIHNDEYFRKDLGCPLNCSCLDKYLDCTKLNLKTVPEIPDWIRTLDLSQNKLDDTVEESIRNLSKLANLKLNKNRLDKFPIFIGLSSLATLQLIHNNIAFIPAEALLALPKLTNLDLSKNLITNILPTVFPSKNHLKQLNLNYNNIGALNGTLNENAFINLKQLTDLKLNNNRLTTVNDATFREMKVLRRLELSYNRLSKISWMTFSDLSELRVLKLRNNNIGHLMTGVFHSLKNLITLELDNNRLTSLSKDIFYNLTSMTSLLLSNNTISVIEKNSWEFCPRLTTIDLSANKLQAIDDDTFDCLAKLKELNLQNNVISSLTEGAFNCTTNLKYLDMSNNQISWSKEGLHAPFIGLRKLDRFLLAANNIKAINEHVFTGLVNVTYLDLLHNNITALQKGSFDQMPKLKKLLLNTTNLLCDCNVNWLSNRLDDDLYSEVFIACGFPVQLRGKQLKTLQKNELSCNETTTPRFIEEPAAQLAITGSNITLNCSVLSTTSLLFKWRKDNNEIDTISVITSFKQQLSNDTITTAMLNIYNVSFGNAGRYQCITTNRFGTIYSQKAAIEVASLPAFKIVPSNITINATSIARLDCGAVGDPKPEISWQKDGGNDFPAARERRMHVMPADDAFFIINTKVTDQGVYTCTAENAAGIVKANGTLIVHEPPTFVKPMEHREVTSGKSAVLECMAAGSPKPTLHWQKDGKPIETTERHFFAAEDQLLIIVEAIMSDSGTYRCEIRNSLGRQSDAVILKVTPPINSNVINIDEMTGIVIITVVCCAVGTSIVWVVIIYQSKRGNGCTNYTGPADSSGTLLAIYGVSAINDNKKVSFSIKTTENEALLHNGNIIVQPTQRSAIDDVGQSMNRMENMDESPGRNSTIALNIDSDDRTSLTISISASPVLTTTTTPILTTHTPTTTNTSSTISSSDDTKYVDRRMNSVLPVNIVNNKLNNLLISNEIEEMSL